MVDAALNPPPIGLQFGFARAARADAAAQLRHRFAPPGQPRQHVLKLRQLHLQLALAGPRMARKNVQDQLRPVQHPARQRRLKIAQLGGRQVVVEEHQVGLGGSGDARQSPPLCLRQSASPDRAVARRCISSAATTPPALETSSRNSARDSSASSPGAFVSAACVCGAMRHSYSFGGLFLAFV